MYFYSIYYFLYRSDMSGFMQSVFFFGYMACICYGVRLVLELSARASLAAVPVSVSCGSFCSETARSFTQARFACTALRES